MVIILVLIGVIVGWVARSYKAKGEARVSVYDGLVQEGFLRYEEMTGELHPADPRRMVQVHKSHLKVVK